MKKITIILLIFNVLNCFGQDSVYVKYYEHIKNADSLFKCKEYLKSANSFSSAFETLGWRGFEIDRYNAACSWAMSNIPDSAFYNLYKITEKLEFSNYEKLINDTNLNSLHIYDKWQALLLLVNENKLKKEKIEANLNQSLIKLLDSLAFEDQKWRQYSTKYKNKEISEDTISYAEIWQNVRLTDSLNYYYVRNIFNQFGFPNYDLVGENGSSNFWLLVQHQDSHPLFQDSILTKMKIEVDAGKASNINYAYLFDRVKINTNQLQMYGTQLKLNSDSTTYEPISVFEPENLNERRKSIGLPTIEEYIEFANNLYHGSLKKQ